MEVATAISARCTTSTQFVGAVQAPRGAVDRSSSFSALRAQPFAFKKRFPCAYVAALRPQARERCCNNQRQSLGLASISSSKLTYKFGAVALQRKIHLSRSSSTNTISADANVDSEQDQKGASSEDEDVQGKAKASQEASSSTGGSKTFYLFEKPSSSGQEKAAAAADQGTTAGDGGKPKRPAAVMGGRPATIRSWLGDESGDNFAGWSFPPSLDGRKGGRFRGLPETAAALVLAVAVAGVSYRVFNRSDHPAPALQPAATTTLLPNSSTSADGADTEKQPSDLTDKIEAMAAATVASPVAPPPPPPDIPVPEPPETSPSTEPSAASTPANASTMAAAAPAVESPPLEKQQPAAHETDGNSINSNNSKSSLHVLPEANVSTIPSPSPPPPPAVEEANDDLMGEELSFPQIVLPWSSPETEDSPVSPEKSSSSLSGNLPSLFSSSFGRQAVANEPAPVPSPTPTAPPATEEPASPLVLGKVVVPAVVDPLQQQAFAALQSLQVIEPDAELSGICTRREYARWLVHATNLLNKSCSSRVFPAMFIEGVSELAFDDVQPDDPDFAKIQGLAEAGLIPSRLSRSDLKCDRDPPKAGCSPTAGGAFFRPDSPLTRQDLIAWKVALEHVYLPDPDVKVLEKNWGLIDIDRIDPDALRAVALDLTAGDKSSFAAAFGYTRRLQPNKPVTRAQAASALSAGEMREAMLGELERMEAERLAEAAIEQVFAAEERADREFSEQKSLEDADLRRRREEAQKLSDQVKKELEEARQELEAARREREEERLRRALELASEREVVVRERAAAEAERETLLRERLEVEERIASLLAARLEADAGRDQAEKLRTEAMNARQEALRMREVAESERRATAQARVDAEAECRALSLAREWAEDEAKKARAQATKLQEARMRWEASGLEIQVDEESKESLEAGKLAGPTWEFAGRQLPGSHAGGPIVARVKRAVEKGGEIGRSVRDKVGHTLDTRVREAREGLEVVGSGLSGTVTSGVDTLKGSVTIGVDSVKGTVASGVDAAKRAADAVKSRTSKLLGGLSPMGGGGSNAPGTASAAGSDSK